ncbi:hypothetical protein [Campylobacter mucosalis]|uniref:Uncharacterized protein n=1 Tax=Campylobacter mucosalis CCUG 21559 TaxID=1032067 RepID=A0A6G5QIG7_9BACT|nr:hypothetical protein [Campylobacter mucosalis]QCD45286.1 hypothetical protein CMUC_1527 [Campylobacter mucosalis CCUG 21559]
MKKWIFLLLATINFLYAIEKSVNFKGFGSYFNDELKELILIDKDTNTSNIIFWDNKILKDSNNRIWKKLEPLKVASSFVNKNSVISIAPERDNALISGKIDGHFIDAKAVFKDGVYIAGNLKIIALKDKIFISKMEFKKIDNSFLITKNSVGRICKNSHSQDLIKEFGTNNLKRITQIKQQSAYYALSLDERLFAYEIYNNKITKLNILSPKFKTIEGIGLNSSFKDIKNSLKIDDFSVHKNKISLKIDSYNMVLHLLSDIKNEPKSLEDIDENAKVKQILISW